MAIPVTPDQAATQQQMADASAQPNPATAAPMLVASANPAPTAQATPAPAVTPAGTEMLGASDLDSTTAAGATPNTLFGTKLARALDANALPLKPNGKPVPGGWARSLLGAWQNVAAGLGDISTERAPAGAGIVSGFAKAAANRNQRVAAQQAQQHKQELEDEENQRANQQADAEQQKAQLALTHANIQFQHEQALWHQIHEVEPNVQQGKAALATLENSPHPAPIEARDITSDELKQGVISGKWNHHDFTAFPSAVQTNPDGSVRALYTVVKASGPVTLGDDDVKYLNDNQATDQKIQLGQTLSFSQWNTLYQNASNNAAATAARNKTLLDNDLTDKKQAQQMEVVNIGPEWNNALANAQNDPLRALANMQANPTIVQKYPNLFQDVRQAYGEKNFDSLIETRQKQIDQNANTLGNLLNDPSKLDSEGKANAVYATATQKLKDPTTPPDQRVAWQTVQNRANQIRTLNADDKKKLDSAAAMIPANTNLSGQAYLNTLPGPAKSLVTMIGSGQMPLNRLDYLASKNPQLLESVAIAYPNFDASKIKNYVDTSKDFTSGKTSVALNSGGTALMHLKDLYDNTTTQGVLNPGSKEYRQRQADLNNVSQEIAKFLAGGNAATKEDIASARAAISAGLNPMNWRSGIKEEAKLIQDKLDNYQQTWDNAVPSAAYKRPMPNLSPAARQASAYILNDGKLPQMQQAPAQQTQSAPAPQTHVFDARAWAAANPGKDVNAAINFAKSKGYTVNQ